MLPDTPISFHFFCFNLCFPLQLLQSRLLTTDLSLFKSVMNRWAKPLADGGDPWAYPVLGVEATKLRMIDVPALCMYSWPLLREADEMHTKEVAQNVARRVSHTITPNI